MNKTKAKEIVLDILTKGNKRFRQELAGENEEFLDRVLRQYRAKVARCSWKYSQKWSKWDDVGPVLMPDYTRIYYRKGSTEVLLQEFPPQIRLMKFKGGLVNRNESTSSLTERRLSSTHNFSLALPYVVFLFKFVNGTFTEVRCAFCDRPLKKLEEKPLRPYLSNIDSNLQVCLGTYFDRSQLIKDNVTQQVALVLDHFWHTSYSDEWSSHYWSTRAHFQGCDSRLASLKNWQDASEENALFVVEDVDWLKHNDENFGDMVVRMFEDDQENNESLQAIYNELIDEFFDDVKEAYGNNIEALGDRTVETLVDQLADELIGKV
jgi:hypothetical protein